MFWSDVNYGRVYRAWLNGTGSVQLASGLGDPCKCCIMSLS